MAVSIEKNDAVWTIILHRPEVRNAVDQPTRVALQTAFEDFEADDAARVAGFWGKGGHFCAGADPKAKTADGKTAWDLIQDNEKLKNTDAYWRLNDLQIGG